jgi:hypothetical protein
VHSLTRHVIRNDQSPVGRSADGARSRRVFRRKGGTLLISSLAAGLIAVSAVGGAASPQPRYGAADRMACPSGVRIDRSSLAIGEVLDAARRLIPDAYRAIPPGRPQRALIFEARSLQPQIPPLPGASFWRSVAARRCGLRTANASWVIAVVFPDSKVVVPTTGIVFLAHTSRGWRLWYRYR